MSNPDAAPIIIRTQLLRHIATGKVSAHDQLDAKGILAQGGYERLPDNEEVTLWDIHGTHGKPSLVLSARKAEEAIYYGRAMLPNR